MTFKENTLKSEFDPKKITCINDQYIEENSGKQSSTIVSQDNWEQEA